MDSKNIIERGSSVAKDGQAHDRIFARKSDGKVIFKIDGTNAQVIGGFGITSVKTSRTLSKKTNLCDASGGNFTVYLPLSAQSVYPDLEITIINVGASGTVTVAPTGSDTIFGAASVALTSGQGNTFIPDGSSKWIIKSST